VFPFLTVLLGMLAGYLYTGDKGAFTQQVHCEFFVVSEAICLVATQQVSGGLF
jgi:hypothetical protein